RHVTFLFERIAASLAKPLNNNFQRQEDARCQVRTLSHNSSSNERSNNSQRKRAEAQNSSAYVPPDRKIHEVLGQLREELGTAVNIKTRTTRNNVQDGIERTMQRLKLFKEPPPTGLVIFAGAIPQNGAGSEKMETYTLIPPEPITVGFYRCDARFHVEPLLALVADKDTLGILVTH